MKTMFLVVAASLTIASSGALSQANNCSNSYGNCMSVCATGKVKMGADRCVETCQSQSNQCYERAWGARPQTIVTGERPLTPAANAQATPEQPAAAAPAPQEPAPPAPARRKPR